MGRDQARPFFVYVGISAPSCALRDEIEREPNLLRICGRIGVHVYRLPPLVPAIHLFTRSQPNRTARTIKLTARTCLRTSAHEHAGVETAFYAFLFTDRPHLPFAAPHEYFSRYPPVEEIPLAHNREFILQANRDDDPRPWNPNCEISARPVVTLPNDRSSTTHPLLVLRLVMRCTFATNLLIARRPPCCA